MGLNSSSSSSNLSSDEEFFDALSHYDTDDDDDYQYDDLEHLFSNLFQSIDDCFKNLASNSPISDAESEVIADDEDKLTNLENQMFLSLESYFQDIMAYFFSDS
ncbi:hypothetical protein M5689_022938 [Euphorbia peplus]|nr:hypothetical protein M5689_022938 [Euphorbia peplus]